MSPTAECDKQDFVADGMSTYDIVDQYAEDHSVWAEAFLGAWQRMQELRQDQNDMKEGPANSWLGYYPLQEMGAVTGEVFPLKLVILRAFFLNWPFNYTCRHHG